MEFTYIYISCMGHSGSTLLELICGAHSKVLAVGELSNFSDYYHDPSKLIPPATQICEHPFWRKVVSKLGFSPDDNLQRIFPNQSRRLPWLKSLHRALLLASPRLALAPGAPYGSSNFRRLNNHWKLAKAIVEVSGKNILVDASMSPSRLVELWATAPPGCTFKVVHLTRDGRSNMNSFMRNFSFTPSAAAHEWTDVNWRLLVLLRRYQAIPRIRIFYETLCRDPEGTVRSLCQFMGLEWEPLMLDFRRGEQIGIGGNPMRFRPQEKEIVLDEKWRTELTQEDLAVFERIGGRVNRQLGYETTNLAGT